MIEIELTVQGKNGSGKSRILEEIKNHLEEKGLNVESIPEDEHKLKISGELN